MTKKNLIALIGIMVLTCLQSASAQPVNTVVLAENVDQVIFNPYVDIELRYSDPGTAQSPGMTQRSLKTSASPQNPDGVTACCCGDGMQTCDERLETCAVDSGGYGGCGELTGDGKIDLWDVAMLVNVAFRGGSLPSFVSPWRADTLGSGAIDISDVVTLIDYAIRNDKDALRCIIP